jgi:hypothetical protein
MSFNSPTASLIGQGIAVPGRVAPLIKVLARVWGELEKVSEVSVRHHYDAPWAHRTNDLSEECKWLGSCWAWLS